VDSHELTKYIIQIDRNESRNPHKQTAHTSTKQYNLVPAKERWYSTGGEVTAGLAESNGSLPPRFMASVTCGLTAEDRELSGTLCSFRVWD